MTHYIPTWVLDSFHALIAKGVGSGETFVGLTHLELTALSEMNKTLGPRGLWSMAEPPISELTGYRRIPLDACKPTLQGGSLTNTKPLVFPKPLADWGVIRGVFFADGPGTDARLIAATGTDPRSIKAGDVAPRIDSFEICFCQSPESVKPRRRLF